MKAILTFLYVISFTWCLAQNDSLNYKINGVSFVSSNYEVEDKQVVPILDVGATWVAVIPFGFMSSKSEPLLSFDNDWQWYGERIEGTRQMIQKMHQHGLGVLLKPQVWIGMGDYTGFVDMVTEEKWLSLESNYEQFILAFAELAEEEQVGLLSIGTEMSVFATSRPEFWRALIKKVRAVYGGRLTYAENWDTFDKVEFWDDLDFIGIDAYFPLTNGKKAGLNAIINGWEEHESVIDSVSTKFDKKVLFTEFGYRSIDNCTKEPWDYSKNEKTNEKAQRDALKALFHVFWDKENFAGGFLWKWWPNHQSAGGKSDATFTVQNKISEQLVKTIYSN